MPCSLFLRCCRPLLGALDLGAQAQVPGSPRDRAQVPLRTVFAVQLPERTEGKVCKATKQPSKVLDGQVFAHRQTRTELMIEILPCDVHGPQRVFQANNDVQACRRCNFTPGHARQPNYQVSDACTCGCALFA